MKNSYFITLEGIEGSGKSTQVQNIKNYFENNGYTVTLLREPGGTYFGESLRSVILNSNEKINPLSEAMLFASSRAQLLEQKILPKLKEPKNVVIVDRYIDSSFAYQGHARELGIDLIEDLHKHAPLNTMPDLTFYLKIDLNTSFKRQAQRGNNKDYFEKEKEEFYLKLIEGFDICAQKFKRIKTIDATKSPDEVSHKIYSFLKEKIHG